MGCRSCTGKRSKKPRSSRIPGCYPTSAILGLAPLHQEGHGSTSRASSSIPSPGSPAQDAVRRLPIIIPEANEGLMAYKIGTHRHTPEIEQELSALAGKQVTVSFTPHLVPMNRGILTTIYAKLTEQPTRRRLHALYQEFYKHEPFVRVLAVRASSRMCGTCGDRISAISASMPTPGPAVRSWSRPSTTLSRALGPGGPEHEPDDGISMKRRACRFAGLFP